MKKVTLKISLPLKGLQKGKEFLVNIKDDGTIIDAIAMADKYVIKHPEESIFPIYEGYIHNYMQLLINPEENKIYEDIGLMPYGPDEAGNMRRFMPLRENIDFNLYPDSIIDLQPDSGCWWEAVKKRLDIGRFKTVLRKKYGKNNETFSHYFVSNDKSWLNDIFQKIIVKDWL